MALSFLTKGDATEWRDQAVEAIEASKSGMDRVMALEEGAARDKAIHLVPYPPFTTFQDFIYQFQACFCDSDPGATACTKLEYIAMGMDTAEQYIQNFKKYQ